MAKSTFSGPVKSLAGFISAGVNNSVSLTADTTLTVDAHAGKILLCNDADGKFTLPSISSTTPSDPTDPNQANNIGASFFFYIETLASDLDIKTDGTDKFVGNLVLAAAATSQARGFAPGATNDVISMNGTTTGGIAGSYVEVTALATAEYLVTGALLASGTIVTPFADA